MAGRFIDTNKSKKGFETRYEWLRPGQLRQRQEQCSLIIFPIAPLEYHGPHMPLGTDAINASRVAHACCRKLQKGVVRPVLTIGTETNRTPEIIESLGFEPGSDVVGMDFPTRLWNSHYLPEEIFAATLEAELKILIEQGYKYIFIANGHGAANQIQVISKLCSKFTDTDDANLDHCLTFTKKVLDQKIAGHAAISETSLLMHYKPDCVDLNTLPPRDVPIKYKDFSIVDYAGFTPDYAPERIVKHDPRDASAETGRQLFEGAVQEVCAQIENLLNKQ